MAVDTTWDIDYYKTDYESEEHWNLRKRFMEIHKEKFGEDELVCLAQVFTNVEFMGCKYPADTMELVAHLSQEVAEEFRKNRSNRLKRTFVQASDAAEARAKGHRTKAIENNSNDKRKFPQFNAESPSHQTPKSKFQAERLYDGLPYGKFVLYLPKDRSCIHTSAQKSNVICEDKETILNNTIKVDITVGGKVVASHTGNTAKEVKAICFENAIKALKRVCYTIKINPKCEKISVNKTNTVIVADVNTNEDATILGSNNIGYKMMKKLGWSGGGLGCKKEGRQNPVEFLVKTNRKGLGNMDGKVDTQYFRGLLTDYIKSDDIRDLYFQSSFSTEERASLHQIASTVGLKSKSYGKGEDRYLSISKKLTINLILEEILINKNSIYMNKYMLQVPENKAHFYPDHVNIDFGED